MLLKYSSKYTYAVDYTEKISRVKKATLKRFRKVKVTFSFFVGWPYITDWLYLHIVYGLSSIILYLGWVCSSLQGNGVLPDYELHVVGKCFKGVVS